VKNPLAALSVNQRFVLAAVLSTVAVAIALVTQYAFDMQPCPWCVLQRVLFLLVAVLSLFAVAVRSRPARFALGAAAVLASLAGISAALYQHFVAAQLSSCALTLADRILNATGIEGWWPAMFAVRASCADAAIDLLGLPYEFWSLGVYVVVSLVLIGAIARLRAAP
jgi:protein dithiol:quinone oxidoreductase